MAKQENTITFKPMPEWVIEDFKDALTEDIDNGIIKTMEDAFYYTKGWFGQKGCVPIAVFEFISELNRGERLK